MIDRQAAEKEIRERIADAERNQVGKMIAEKPLVAIRAIGSGVTCQRKHCKQMD